jgi:Domain of unknown function (DUF6265)
MKHIHKQTILLIITVMLLLNVSGSLAQKKQNKGKQLTEFAWLVGTWKMPAKNGFLYEKWEKVSDSVFKSKAYKIKNTGDTMMMESVTIEVKNGDYYYISTVADQNNQQPVPFKITTLTNHGFIAENKAHDYPQRIAYELQSDGILYAFIDGRFNGKYNKNEFRYSKGVN